MGKPAWHALMCCNATSPAALFVMLVKMDGAATAEVPLRDCEQVFSPLDDALRQTLTCDHGKDL